MPTATIIDSVIMQSVTPYISILYEEAIGVSANTDSTSLIVLELPGLYTSHPSYIREPRKLLIGKSYALSLGSFSISCKSTNFDYRLLNRDDITLISTVYEVSHITGINLNTITIPVAPFIIRNRDVVLDNKLYLYIENKSGIDTGVINIELNYLSIQDREF